ncbi:MAG: FMN-binding protein [Fusobacteriaceae bacterium]
MNIFKTKLFKLILIFLLSFFNIFGEIKEYIASEKGYNGEIQVKVLFEKNKLVDIEVLKNPESKFAKATFETIIKNVIDTQSVIVDNVAGATYTSNGLKGAIEKAILESKVELIKINK